MNLQCSEMPPTLYHPIIEAGQKAEAELDRRKNARTHLIDFTRYTFPGYSADPAHELIAQTLDQVVSGEIKRLMIFAPPQHGKSELASVRLPAFWLAKNPNLPVILTSYGASLAEDKSEQVRTLVESEGFRRLFPKVSTHPESRARSLWKLCEPHRGKLIAAGVGGPITGFGGGLGIIDDPVQNWEAAQSKTQKEKTWHWYRSTFRTRIWEGGAIVLMMTRWSEDDLAGRILDEQAEEWTILRLPAVAEDQTDRDANNETYHLPAGMPDPLGRNPGDPLCPTRYSVQELKKLEKDVGSEAWNAEYQAAPMPPGGIMFKREWFCYVDEVPATARRVRWWDFAATDDGGGYTAGVLMAEHNREFFVEDVERFQLSPAARDQRILATAQADADKYGNRVDVWCEEEGGSSGKEVGMKFVQMLAGFPARSERVTGSKEVRAHPFATQAEAGNVKLKKASWNKEYLDELCAFPSGKYKDQVDASSGSFSKLSLFSPANIEHGPSIYGGGLS